MPRSRDIPRQQIGEPTFEPSTQTETMENSECITDGPRLNFPGIKMPEFLPSDLKIWFSILNKTLKENGITNDTGKFTYALTAIGPKFYNEN